MADDAKHLAKPLTGSCLCGGVRYEINGEARPVANCFCSQCRKTSGHYVAATQVAEADLHLVSETTLRWYESSPGVTRGFCQQCGGNVFWTKQSEPFTSVFAGTLDTPTGLHTGKNIYVEDASDYHEIPDLS